MKIRAMNTLAEPLRNRPGSAVAGWQVRRVLRISLALRTEHIATRLTPEKRP
jgi:hypothetical protein